MSFIFQALQGHSLHSVILAPARSQYVWLYNVQIKLIIALWRILKFSFCGLVWSIFHNRFAIKLKIRRKLRKCSSILRSEVRSKLYKNGQLFSLFKNLVQIEYYLKNKYFGKRHRLTLCFLYNMKKTRIIITAILNAFLIFPQISPCVLPSVVYIGTYL